MSGLFKLKADWDDKTPAFRHKAQKLLDSGNESTSVNINPFLDAKGKLVNPYINYQGMLDNPKISNKVKDFIQQATGLTPAQTASVLTVSPTATSRAATSSGIGAGAGTDTEPAEETPKSTDSGIVAAAKGYIGTPYVWGGESMSEGGMDCSGFVYNALRDAGYDIGRTTAQGYRSYGNTVSKDNMQPGDLIFYGSGGNATHVGIYIGDGQMIHSSGGSKNTKTNPGKGVSITNVDYRSDFIEARRY